MLKTFMLKKEDVKREWHIFDAKGKVLGRLASEIATLLIGKHKKDYTPHIDNGDYVVVINAKEVKLTGKKLEQKLYRSHSGYPGGYKERKANDILAKKPEELIRLAVLRMLPKNRLQKLRIKRLKIFAGSEHPFEKYFKK